MSQHVIQRHFLVLADFWATFVPVTWVGRSTFRGVWTADDFAMILNVPEPYFSSNVTFHRKKINFCLRLIIHISPCQGTNMYWSKLYSDGSLTSTSTDTDTDTKQVCRWLESTLDQLTRQRTFSRDSETMFHSLHNFIVHLLFRFLNDKENIFTFICNARFLFFLISTARTMSDGQGSRVFGARNTWFIITMSFKI